MERILRAEGDWQATLAKALRRVPRPIPVDPRLTPRDREATGSPRYERSSMPPARRAATLMALYPRLVEGALQLVIPLTVRHAGLRSHAGEVSLPGGAVDETDASPQAAALREAWEEVGMAPDEVEILGSLDSVWIPVSNFELRAFVGVLSTAPTLVAHEPEVEAIVELPARVLVADDGLIEELIEGPGWRLRAGGYRHGEHLVWGATARSLAMFGSVLRLAAELSGESSAG
ncbi:MAG TPA: CoA pyrophosphatase [Candidatus Limnocylindria bacterium]|nr:CoA pyrophosphatase [Candidatus Limnocylindria bacterium]